MNRDKSLERPLASRTAQIPRVAARAAVALAVAAVQFAASRYSKMTENNLRHRTKSETKYQNGSSHKEEKSRPPEFAHRESPLTLLKEASLHIRVIYHIFIVILLILLCDSVVYDLIDTGRINIGLSVIKYGFGDIGRGARLWLFELSVALSFFPGLKLYAAVKKLARSNKAVSQFVNKMAIAGLVLLQGILLLVPTWDLSRKHLALGSAVAVTCEMFRFAMKIHAVAIAYSQRKNEEVPTFRHYLYFLFAPTLLYRDEYPRTKKIRWGFVLFHILEVAAIIFYNSFLWQRFILPNWSNYGKEAQVYAGVVVRGMFACVLPGVISFLCGFYCLLHAWLNATAELLRFGDRLFYEDWWTTSQFSRYYRAWNRVVYSWLKDHIYRPLAPRAGRAVSTFTVFLISAVAHEVILALSFGFFYPVLLMEFGVLGLLMLPLTATTGPKYPNVFNMLMWLSFFIGNGILWSLYPMEYFARKNCPASPTDSFFIPKSWSCPEIVLKPDWSFKNPFSILY